LATCVKLPIAIDARMTFTHIAMMCFDVVQ